jgi:hypothetical protein
MNIKAIRRDALWLAQEGLCHWCGRPTSRETTAEGRCQPDTATLDHLLHKRDYRRGTCAEPGEKRYVMACYECNFTRGRE